MSSLVGPNLEGNIVGFGQKSGTFWALNPDDGNIVWSTPVGPGASLGGIEWGTATDGKRIYVAIANSDHLPYTLVPSGQKITWGAWSDLDVATGKILWQTADPTEGTIDRGSVSVANGVMYAGSNSGQMYALDAETGNVLWNFASGGSNRWPVNRRQRPLLGFRISKYPRNRKQQSVRVYVGRFGQLRWALQRSRTEVMAFDPSHQ